MKTLLKILLGIVLGAAILVAGAITLLWLFCDNSVSINLRNSSGVPLQNVAVIVPDSAFSGDPSDMGPDSDFAFGTNDRMRPRTKLPLRVIFDGGGHHYDVPIQLRLAPFGSYYVFITIDEHMQVSFKLRFL